METLHLDTWEELQEKIRSIDEGYRVLKKKSDCYVDRPLFRGHSNADWKLETTLERKGFRDYSFESHHRNHILPAYEEITLKIKPLKAWKLEKQLALGFKQLRLSFPNYAFLSFLRHYAFPSPLLDWTSCYLVALYFAFNETNQASSKRVALYCFQERMGDMKIVCMSQPHIHQIGPYIETTNRHFKQRADYTICVSEKNYESVIFNSHEKALSSKFRTGGDYLRKFTLPSSERDKVLAFLKTKRINSDFLFPETEYISIVKEAEKSIFNETQN